MPIGEYLPQEFWDDLSPQQPTPRQNHSHRLPDAKWIRKNIPIANVARELGLNGDGRVFDCFSGDHPAGKRKRSLSIHGKSNTMRCFDCDTKSLSNIDLVVQVMGISLGDAIKWIDLHFPGVPQIELKPKPENRHRHRESKTLNPQALIISRGWAEMSLSAKAVITAIIHRSPQAGSEQFMLRCSYDELMAWTGIGSKATISNALTELRRRPAISTWTEKRKNRAGFMVKELVIRILPQAMRSTESTESVLRTAGNKKKGRTGQSTESVLRTISTESVLLN